MEETKVKGIIINSTDYKEADKIVSVFSLEEGVIPVKFTGVRRSSAKLKHLCNTFSFVELELVENKNYHTVKTGEILEIFPKIVSNYEKTICACVCLDIIKSILPKNKKEEEIFAITLACLQNIESGNHFVALIEFIKSFFMLLGEELNLECEKPVYLDKSIGDFSHERTPLCVEIDYKVYNALNGKEENNSINKMAIKLLGNILFLKYDTIIKSISFI